MNNFHEYWNENKKLLTLENTILNAIKIIFIVVNLPMSYGSIFGWNPANIRKFTFKCC